MRSLYPCLLAASALIGATASSSSSQCTDSQYCVVTACINPAPTPGVPPGAFLDFNCSNLPATFFGSKCDAVDTHQRFNGPTSDWALIGLRVVCSPPGKPVLMTDKCGNRLGGSKPGGACTMIVGSCGGQRIAAGC